MDGGKCGRGGKEGEIEGGRKEVSRGWKEGGDEGGKEGGRGGREIRETGEGKGGREGGREGREGIICVMTVTMAWSGCIIRNPSETG